MKIKSLFALGVACLSMAAVAWSALDASETLGGKGTWATLTLTWDWTARKATLACGDRTRTYELRTDGKSPFGPSYMHLQTLAEGHDPKGAYFRSFRKTSK